jgi:dynein heavy chain
MGLYRSTTGKDLSLVFFKDAIKHLCRITRALRQPRGNVLLIGVGGSGRQSLTTVASYIAKGKLFQIEITKNYKEQQWKDDLKRLLKLAGKDNQKAVFLYNDTQVLKESMLEDINNL